MHATEQGTFRKIDDIRARELEVGSSDGVMQYKTRVGCFKRGIHEDWAALEPLIRDIVLDSERSTNFGSIDDLGRFDGPSRAPIARIEFVRDLGSRTNVIRRGAVVFDSHWNALFHAELASLGFSSPVNVLSANILKTVGVPESVIDEANAYARWHLRGELVFTRENVVQRNGDEYVQSDDQVAEEWRWLPVPYVRGAA